MNGMRVVTITPVVPFGSDVPAGWHAYCHHCRQGDSFSAKDKLDAWTGSHMHWTARNERTGGMGTVSEWDLMDTAGEAGGVAKATLRVEMADGSVREIEIPAPASVKAARTSPGPETYSAGSWDAEAGARKFARDSGIIAITVAIGEKGWQARIAPPER